MRNMSKPYKVCVCAHFALGKTKLNGQVIKTKIVTQELENRVGKKRMLRFDTQGGVKNLFVLPFKLLKATRSADNLVILPAHKGIQFMSFILTILHIFSWQCKVHYSVIGAWLPSYLKRNRFFRFCLRHGIDVIYVETQTMKQALTNLGFNNTAIMPNCKQLEIFDERPMEEHPQLPLRLCTFSRINRLKGLKAAIESIQEVNTKSGKTVFTIDFFGTVDKGEEKWFETFQQHLPDFARYRGFIPYDKSTATLRNYFALLFPTLSYTEGVPGTIIDAYAAGLPVICSRWESYADVIKDGVTGFSYKFEDTPALTAVLMQIARNPSVIELMRTACLRMAHNYLPQVVLNVMEERLK